MKKPVTKDEMRRGERITHLRKLLGMNQERFATLIEDVSRGAVGNWERGLGISLENLARISERTGASLDWLNNGDGPAPRTKADLGTRVVPPGFEFEDPEPSSRTKVSEGMRFAGAIPNSIPDIETEAGAGPGRVAITVSDGETLISGDAVRGEIVLPGYLLNEYTAAGPGNVHAVKVRGDSMLPTLSTGDRVFVDTTDKAIGQGGVFVVLDRRSDEVLVKRLRRVFSERGYKIQIVSDNPLQDGGKDDLVSPDLLIVIGRAVARLTRI